jgi:acetyltransferase
MANDPVTTDPGESWTSVVVLADGTPMTIRPLSPERDRALEIEFLASLSERTRYLRLFTPLRYLPPHMLDQFMDVDGERRVALVGTVIQDGRERFIGVARYGVTDEPAEAEVGITVADAWQRRGVAVHLIQRLMDYGRAHGIRKLTGVVLPENSSMLSLARRLGFEVHLAAREHLMRIEKAL